MMVALWLVVAIAAVALHFALEARDRRVMGLNAGDRGRSRAAAAGALAMVQAQLEYVQRQTATARGNAASLRSSDPWLSIDSLFDGALMVDQIPVTVSFSDPASKLNINGASPLSLQAFFNFVLRNSEKASALSDAIMDWRDPDSLPRINGAERAEYLKEGLLYLPTNLPFGSVDELRHVFGMTPEIFAAVAPYLTIKGNGQVNINNAPEAVLRSINGITDDVVATILALRSQGRRIANLNEVLPAGAGSSGRGGGGTTGDIGGRGGMGGRGGGGAAGRGGMGGRGSGGRGGFDGVMLLIPDGHPVAECSMCHTSDDIAAAAPMFQQVTAAQFSQQRLQASMTVSSSLMDVILTAKPAPEARPTQLVAELRRVQQQIRVERKQW